MNIPESQCDFAIKKLGEQTLVHCVLVPNHKGKHESPYLSGKDAVQTEGEWFQV